MPQDEKARRRSNTAPNGDPCITAEELSKGVTLEQLQRLPVPVFAYQTQITIHGKFPEITGRCEGYKLLTRNANGSLGVRYAGIDAGKKRAIANAVYISGSKWGAILDSQGLTLQLLIASVSEGREVIAAIPSGVYGSAGMAQCMISGRLYVVVNVGAVKESSLWDIVKHLTGMTQQELEKKESAMKAEREQRNAQRIAEQQARAVRNDELLETLRVKLVESGNVPMPRDFTPRKGDTFRVLKLKMDGSPALITYTLAMRGPVLCIVREGMKGRKVDDATMQSWKRAAAAGRVFSLATVTV